jgi:hypothetical protein
VWLIVARVICNRGKQDRNPKRECLEKETDLNIMKKLTSALLGLTLSLAVAGISFAQTPAPAPAAPAAKDNGSAMNATTKKKSKKKANHKAAATTPAAPATTAK